jgi:hypothetical protein
MIDSRKQQKGPLLEPYAGFEKTADGTHFGALSWLLENSRMDHFGALSWCQESSRRDPFEALSWC